MNEIKENIANIHFEKVDMNLFKHLCLRYLKEKVKGIDYAVPKEFGKILLYINDEVAIVSDKKFMISDKNKWSINDIENIVSFTNETIINNLYFKFNLDKKSIKLFGGGSMKIVKDVFMIKDDYDLLKIILVSDRLLDIKSINTIEIVKEKINNLGKKSIPKSFIEFYRKVILNINK